MRNHPLTFENQRNRVRQVAIGVRLLIATAFLLFAPIRSASAMTMKDADDTWRIAGTFNHWNTRDPSMQLSPLPDGTYFIQTTIPAGRQEFKFVRNGDWGKGHLGANPGSTNHLTHPGENIVTNFDTTRPVSILFDPVHRTWRFGKPTVMKPVAVATLRGPARIGLPVVLDLSDTLVPEGAPIEEFELRAADPESAQIIDSSSTESTPKTNLSRRPARTIIPQRAGSIEILVRVKARGEWSEPTRITIDVHDRVFAVLPFRAEVGPIDLVPINGSDEWAAVFTSPGTGVVAAKIQDLGRSASTTTLAHPTHKGEIFAIVYSRNTGNAHTIPGTFDLVPNGQEYRLLDLTPVPENGFFHDPRRADHFTPISAGLGLVDITVETHDVLKPNDPYESQPTPNERLTLFVMSKNTRDSFDPDKVLMQIPMAQVNTVAAEDGSVRAKWKARIRLPEATNGRQHPPWIRYWIDRRTSNENFDSTTKNPTPRFGPFDAQIKPDFETPDWAKRAVWYQIFPERYRNGNQANDPHGEGVFVLPWNSEWHVLHPGEFEAWQRRVRAGGENPDQWDRAKTGEPGGRFYNVVWDRRYGGDLQGIIETLDYLKSMGLTAIYLNPVFEAQSMHKYDTSDYRHIDDNFGNQTTVPPAVWTPDESEQYDDPSTWKWTEADITFLKLIREVHKRKMHIIIDGVFNHVGKFHPAFQDVVKNGINSPFADWFTCEFDKDGNLKSWTAWDGSNGWLPKFKQEKDRSLVYPVQKHIFDITNRWMDPNGDGDPSDGIDGWRLDVPLEIGDPFWRDWCAYVRSINSDAYITAEIWSDWESVSRLKGDEFDAQMDYPFAKRVIDWLAMRPRMPADDLNTELRSIFDNDAPQTQLVQQNLFESHDTDRLLSDLFNSNPPRAFDTGNRPQQGEPYNESKPDVRPHALSRLAAVMEATYVGAPMIFYGQEIGMFGADDPSCRKPKPWPDNPPMVNPEDAADETLRHFYQSWLNRRAENETLQLGIVRTIPTGRFDVLAYERRLNDQILTIIINKSERSYDANAILPGDHSQDNGSIVAPLSARMFDVSSTRRE